jgi:hypothetical protein
MELGGLLAAGTFAAVRVGAEDAEGTSMDDIPPDAQLLFVQSARNVVLADGVLTLNGMAPTMTFFTDRPERIVGHVETEHLVEALIEDKSPDSFHESPPNATLSVLSDDWIDEVTVVLNEPEIDGDQMVFPVEVLDGVTELEGGPASLFIDPVGAPMTPTSVAGVHRRHRRRARRRVRRHR